MDAAKLDGILRMFVADLPNARAARSHELLVEKLNDAVEVFLAKASDDSESLFVVDGDGGVAEARVDTVGASIAYWGRLRGLEVTANYDVGDVGPPRLSSWTLRHPFLTRDELTISTSGMGLDEQARVEAVFRGLLSPNA